MKVYKRGIVATLELKGSIYIYITVLKMWAYHESIQERNSRDLGTKRFYLHLYYRTEDVGVPWKYTREE